MQAASQVEVELARATGGGGGARPGGLRQRGTLAKKRSGGGRRRWDGRWARGGAAPAPAGGGVGGGGHRRELGRNAELDAPELLGVVGRGGEWGQRRTFGDRGGGRSAPTWDVEAGALSAPFPSLFLPKPHRPRRRPTRARAWAASLPTPSSLRAPPPPPPPRKGPQRPPPAAPLLLHARRGAGTVPVGIAPALEDGGGGVRAGKMRAAGRRRRGRTELGAAGWQWVVAEAARGVEDSGDCRRMDLRR
uniref:OSJNBb0004G23.15 protein n=1 Tax=Oryza sativa subsp. japonica TaxID=39947 RepID=Q7X6M4_ORYSJ|nr:OSJNBb0085F13.10 [Oryza sativa Japonica Group]CAE04617.2 OSJNBb0004G23.15 [Oryza sativa Japonica Group]